MVKKAQGRMAVPITAVLALLLTPFTANASVDDSNPAVIEPGKLGSLAIVKLGASSQVPKDAEADGGKVDLKDGNVIRIPGVQFRIEQLTGYDLTSPTGWIKAKTLVDGVEGHENELATLLKDEPKGAATVGCTGWGGVKDEAQIAALEKHCAGINLGGKDEPTGELRFGNLPVGIYLVSEQKTPPNVIPAVPFLVMLPMTDPVDADAWLYDIVVYPKNAMPSLSKEVEDHGMLSLAKGDPVTYTVSLPLPSDTMTLVLTDQLDPKLDFELAKLNLRVPGFTDDTWTDASQEGGPSKYVLSPSGITIEYGTLDDDGDTTTDPVERMLRVTYPESVVKPVAQDGGTLGFDFDAVVNASGEIPNSATFIVTAPGGKATGSTEVVTKWGGFSVRKTAPEDTPLPGAKFNVATSHANAIAKVFLFDDPVQSDADGLVSFTGLRYSYWEDGKEIAPAKDPDGDVIDLDGVDLDKLDQVDTGQIYWLVETEAPLGYVLNSTPIPFRVTGQASSTPAVVIVNDHNAGFELPTIGGNRAILPIVGALVVGGGVVWLIRSRRVND